MFLTSGFSPAFWLTDEFDLRGKMATPAPGRILSKAILPLTCPAPARRHSFQVKFLGLFAVGCDFG
jgi:hypothetical protein